MSLGLELGKNWCQNYNPKWLFFKKSVYLPAFLHNFHTYTIIYFSDPIIKISWEKLGSSGFVEFLPQTFHAPLSHSKWNIEHNSCHKQTKLLTWSPYSVFGKWKWIVKAKSVLLFRITTTLTVQLLLIGFWWNKKCKQTERGDKKQPSSYSYRHFQFTRLLRWNNCTFTFQSLDFSQPFCSYFEHFVEC